VSNTVGLSEVPDLGRRKCVPFFVSPCECTRRDRGQKSKLRNQNSKLTPTMKTHIQLSAHTRLLIAFLSFASCFLATAPQAHAAGVIKVAAGGNHSLFVTSDRALYAVGANYSGQLGDGTTTSRNTSAQVPGATNVVAVAAGGNHSQRHQFHSGRVSMASQQL